MLSLRNAAPPVAHGDLKEISVEDACAQRDLADLLRIGMDDGVRHRLAHGGLDVTELVERRVELRGKRRDRGARQPFVDAAARKFNGYVVIRFYECRSRTRSPCRAALR